MAPAPLARPAPPAPVSKCGEHLTCCKVRFLQTSPFKRLTTCVPFLLASCCVSAGVSEDPPHTDPAFISMTRCPFYRKHPHCESYSCSRSCLLMCQVTCVEPMVQAVIRVRAPAQFRVRVRLLGFRHLRSTRRFKLQGLGLSQSKAQICWLSLKCPISGRQQYR